MKVLFKIEIERAFKNKMFWVALITGLAIALMDIYQNIIPAKDNLDKIIKMGKFSTIQLPGLYMEWMGFKHGAYSFLYYFIMPLLVALPYSISILMDIKKHYVNNVFTRIEKKKYYLVKLFVQFLVGGVISTVPLIISFVGTAMVLPAFKPVSVSSQYSLTKNKVFGELFYMHPLLVVFIIFLFAFIGFGLINCIAYIFADLIDNRFMLSLSPFIICFFYYIMCNSVGRDGPTEYLTVSNMRFSELKFAIIDIVVLAALIIVSYFTRSRRKDVL